jgi:hypothetical protein
LSKQTGDYVTFKFQPLPRRHPSGFIAPVFSVHPSATPIGFSESGYANFGGPTINMLLGIFLGLVCYGVFAVVAQSFLLKLRE